MWILPCGLWVAVFLLLAGLVPAWSAAAQAHPPWPPALQQALAASADAGLSAGDKATLLSSFFRQHPASLNVFCADACSELKPRQQQLQRFFRGSYASLPEGMGPAGKASLKDVYAAHAAAYFSDAAYRCRYPLTAAQLEAVWQLPAAPADCPVSLPFLVTDDEGRRELRWIDPARVHAVHLMFAGASGASLSRFGHVALRLVVCGEHRQQVDAACEEDLFEHLSLGFMAGVDELELSLWKGISGGYPVKLYARDFISTYREYSIDEFRFLQSLPLRMEPVARDLMVRALAQVHWSYQNEYRFFTRNCATELQWLLQTVSALAAPGAETFLKTPRYRPDRLFADARRSPRFDGAVLDDPVAAEREGYFFPGAGAYYQLAVNVFREHLRLPAQSRPQSPEDWRLRPALSRRASWLIPVLQDASQGSAGAGLSDGIDAAYMTQAGLVLEAWVARRLRREILALLGTYYGTLLQELVASEGYFTEPESRLLQACIGLIKAGDETGTRASGVPQEAIASGSEDMGCDLDSPAFVAFMKRFHETFPVLPEHRQRIRELEDTSENIRLLGRQNLPG